MLWCFVCETGLWAVYKINTRNRNAFGQRRGQILRITRVRGRRGATPTFTTVFHFTASKPRLFCQQLWRWGWFGNVAGQQPQPSQWTLPPKPRRRVVHACIGTPLSERCCHRLGMSHDHSCLQGDQHKLSLTSEDWTQVTISTGLAAITRNANAECSAGGLKQTVIFRCVKCDVALCVDQNCFQDYHTKTSL
jgi:hypothetical protein